MTKKILYVIGAILALLVIIDTAVLLTHSTSNEKTGASSNLNSINLVPTANPGGDTYGLAFNGTPMIDLAGDFISTVGNTLVNNFVQGVNGFSITESTSTTLTPAQFCAATNSRFLGAAGIGTNVTTTFPSATSTYALCGGSTFGGWAGQLVTDDATSTASFVAGTGMTFKCETQGVGTTTLAAGVQCTSTTVTINATSTAMVSGYWDAASSSLVLLWGNEYH